MLGAEPSNSELIQYESPIFLNQIVGWKPFLGNYFDSSHFPTIFRAFVLGQNPFLIVRRPTTDFRWKRGTNCCLGAEPSNSVSTQYESPIFFSQNLGWKPFLGNYFDSSRFPTILRAFVFKQNPFRIAGRRRVLKFTKPIRKPVILGFRELIKLVPFFQEIAAFVLVLMELVHLGAQALERGTNFVALGAEGFYFYQNQYESPETLVKRN